MNKKSLPLKRILPGWALVLALALGACGGGGGGDDSGNNNPPPPPTASISSCFTIPSSISYNIAATGVPSGQVAPTSGTSGPITYNGQPVTGQTFNYSGATTVKSVTDYWTVTSAGVNMMGELTVNLDGTSSVSPLNVTFPANMSPGQTVGGLTLVAFENITLAGKTFSNACHMRTSSVDLWYAYGYGVVKRVAASGMTTQYNGDIGSNPTSASITACFTANKTVNFAMTATGVPSGQVGANRSTTGPMTYNGQAVTGQTWFYPAGNTASTITNYWTVTSSGVTIVANVNSNGAVANGNVSFPQNMAPGQTITGSNNIRYTLVGFENITLAGKTFPNTCHIKLADSQGNSIDDWYAPGYGDIKEVAPDGSVTQYSGDL